MNIYYYVLNKFICYFSAMKFQKTSYLLLLSLLLIASSYPQTNDNLQKTEKDSVLRFQGITPRFPLTDKRFYNFPTDFTTLNINNLQLQPGSAWLLTEMELQQSILGKDNNSFKRTDLLNPLYLKYQNEQELKTLRYILGMAQLSAVGYLAYKHIRKYGFIKWTTFAGGVFKTISV